MGIARHPPAVNAGVDGQLLKGSSRLAAYANFVKVAHTVFALPFAVVGMAIASRVVPLDWRKVLLAGLAFASARFAAMGFNRIVDLRYDALNPRTAGRELPSGRMTLVEARILVLLMAALFLACCALINPLCLALAPFALAWLTGYSFTKRFTPLCHLWLGGALAMAPVGGYLALTGAWSTPWWMLTVLALGVVSWVAGFDVLYSLQDEDFDRSHGLKSMTVWLGARGAITVARVMHIVAIAAFALIGGTTSMGSAYEAAVVVAGVLLIWEHRMVRPGDYSRLDAAFFTMNGVISGVIMLGPWWMHSIAPRPGRLLEAQRRPAPAPPRPQPHPARQPAPAPPRPRPHPVRRPAPGRRGS